MPEHGTIDTSAFERDDLFATLGAVLNIFEQAVATRRGPFHTPSVATIGGGGFPRLRTVVLRGFDAERWVVRFHTDRRSGKFREITSNPAIALHVYSKAAKLQVRLCGHASLHTDDDVAAMAWEASRPLSRECYAQRPAPGEILSTPEPDRPPSGLPPEALATARGHFCAVSVSLRELDWLYLRSEGHRRAVFRRCSDGFISGTWVAP